MINHVSTNFSFFSPLGTLQDFYPGECGKPANALSRVLSYLFRHRLNFDYQIFLSEEKGLSSTQLGNTFNLGINCLFRVPGCFLHSAISTPNDNNE